MQTVKVLKTRQDAYDFANTLSTKERAALWDLFGSFPDFESYCERKGCVVIVRQGKRTKTKPMPEDEYMGMEW